MTADQPPISKFSIQPFDPKNHDRTAFSCGAARIDNFLKFSATKQQRGDFARVWVAVAEGQRQVLGYYAINAHAIEADALPVKFTRNAPRHGGVGAAYVSMFGVDKSVQGQGLGTLLIADALKRIALVSDELGIFAVVLDVLADDGAAAIERRQAFYRRLGFVALPSQPLRMFLPVATIRAGLE